MHRDIESDLLQWKNSKTHLPILLKGARQVGKSYVVEALGKDHFENMVKINFELSPEFKRFFENSLKPQEIIKSIELLADQKITPSQTLLFLDEIQECPEAIMSLRYFKELMPELHVIAAGSLLEFALEAEDFKMPVGRVQFFHMGPLSFKEFLSANGNTQLREYLENISWADSIDPSIHEKCLNLLREYLILGGMPAVLNSYFSERSYKPAQDMQSILLLAYQNDFGKYGKKGPSSIEALKLLYQALPERVTQQFKYSYVSQDLQSRELKFALSQLVQANIVHQVFASAGTGLPLNTLINEKKFKLLFLDVGLLKRASNLDISLLMQENLHLVNQGSMVEQYVGQELLAYQDILTPPQVFFWATDQKNAQAELDYLTQINGQILPIEVKSGPYGRLKSLKIFMEQNKISLGIKTSIDPFSAPSPQDKNNKDNQIASVPLYMVSEIGRLVSQYQTKQ